METSIPPSPPSSADTARRAWRASLLALGLGAASTGCVQIYQPISGLHRPVVVDLQAANLQGVRLTVYCLPGDLLNPQDAGVLCQKVASLFENQGAIVQAVAGSRQWQDDTIDAEASDLIMELRSRKVYEYSDPLLEVLFVLTSTLVPMVTETVFAQDVIIRDSSGFLLASDSLEGRLIRRVGVSAWVGNRILNVAWRRGEEKLNDEAVSRDLSTDMYRQLSQLAFNAKLQWEVLQESSLPGLAPTGGGAWR